MSDSKHHQLANWLLAEGPLPEQGRRVWVQVSLVPGQFLSCLEVGPHGSGKTTFWGQGETPPAAMRAALNASEAEPEPELEPAPESEELCRAALRSLVAALSDVKGSQPWGEDYGLAAALLVRLSLADAENE